LRGYHRHPETKFLHGEAKDSGPTQRKHILVGTIEDIGKEADKWDEDEPVGADDDFTVSYGLSVDDRKRMVDVIRSVSKRQLSSAAKISTRAIPATLEAANEMADAKLRRMFAEANVLSEEKRKISDADEALLRWLVKQIDKRGLTSMAEVLEYDAANLTKVVTGKRKISIELRKWICEQMAASESIV
jgi:hypothetical protein